MLGFVLQIIISGVKSSSFLFGKDLQRLKLEGRIQEVMRIIIQASSAPRTSLQKFKLVVHTSEVMRIIIIDASSALPAPLQKA